MWAAFGIFRHSRLIEMAEVLLQDDAALEEDPGTGPERPAPSLLITSVVNEPARDEPGYELESARLLRIQAREVRV
jgi:hypothetical protein